MSVLLGKLTSSLLWVKEERQDLHYKEQLKKVHAALLRSMAQDDDLADGLLKSSPNVLDLVGAGGAAAAIHFEGEWKFIGKTPSIEQMNRLASWLFTHHADKEIFHTNSLPSVYPDSIEYKDIASGLMAISIPKSMRSFVFWFRPEVLQSVTWAGNPKKQIEVMADGSLKIEPRASFESWKEIVSNRSVPWRKVEIEAASELRHSIISLDLRRQFDKEKATRIEIDNERAKFETLFKDSPSAMSLLVGEDLVYEKTNQFFDMLVNRKIVGMKHIDAFPGEEHRPYREMLLRVLHTGETLGGKEREAPVVRRPGGKQEQGFFDFTYTQVCDAEGRPYGVFSHGVDVTEKVLARRRAENLMHDLEKSVQARDEFLSIASHELKTPLASLKLQSQIFHRSITKGETRLLSAEKVLNMAEQTDRQVNRLTRLVEDMMDVARIRGGHLHLELELFDVCEMVKETIERMKPQFISTPAGVPHVVHCEPAIGKWDKVRVEQVITNLLTNALRYGRDLPIDVRVEMRGDNVQISVQDRGIGISPENQEKIFDRFERVSNHNEATGLGLGLFITKQIVKALGGKIWVESELDVGSTFFVELPLHKAES